MKAISILMKIFIIILLLLGTFTLGGNAQESSKEGECLTDIISEIQKLESNRDPKCHATATRLENFMYGTPLAAKTRFLKVKLQKELLLNLWQAVSKAKEAGTDTQQSAEFRREMATILDYSRNKDGDFLIRPKDKNPITIEKRDFEHYSSVAYALRAILALQQEVMLKGEERLVELEQGSIPLLKEFLDIYTLTTLQLADRKARLNNQYEIQPQVFKEAWVKIATPGKNLSPGNTFWTQTTKGIKDPKVKKTAGFTTFQKIVEQKVKSYEAYNKITMQVFLRNLQVYFARHRWPQDPQEGTKFKNLFTNSMVQFAFDSLKYAQEIAKKSGHKLIREEDVHEMWNAFVPFEVNQYEDVIFFPRLGKEGSITVEAYDTDAFRDSGIHWRYLQFAIDDHLEKLNIEPDPFAAELLAEGVSQFGVLSLRIAGHMAKEKGEKQLKAEHLNAALHSIQERITAHAKIKALPKARELVKSSSNQTGTQGNSSYFDDVTDQTGIQFMHRSSDWLSRMLRSYIKKSENVGTLSVPPAFGGSGVASGDIDNDGNPDILILSGAGNALYLGNGKGAFKDITRESGILYRRADGNFPEPRQPIIADFDNDGNQDILITYVDDDHKLYKGMGNGKFTDVSRNAHLGGKNLVGGPATVFDYDRDGRLDIYICYFGDYIHGKLPNLSRNNLNGLPNKLFKNMGNMTFKDVSESSGTGNKGWGQACAHTDLDRDGLQDIIVGNDFGINSYYRNLGDGTFIDVAGQLGTDKPSFTMNVGITDLNRDELPDIYISNIVTMVKDEKYVLPSEETTMKFNPEKLARMRVIEANDLFLSRGKSGKLESYLLSDAVGRGYSSTGWSWDADFFDFDNDSDDDLYVVNGMNEYSVYSDTPYYTNVFDDQRQIQLLVYEKESNVFFVNQEGTLQNQSKKSGTDLLGNSRSTAYLDFDNDGDLDIVLNNYHGAAHVYRNNSEKLGNNWLKIKLIGDPSQKSNRDAIGASIIAYNNGEQLSWREIHGGHGYLSMDPKVQHIGLGKTTEVDLKITWPNGEVSKFTGVKANRTYTIRQDEKKVIAFNLDK